MDYNNPMKIIVLGDKGVGKSNLIRRYAGENFLENTNDVIYDEFIEKELTLSDSDNQRVRITIWDPVMFQINDKIVQAYYTGAHAVCLVFSTLDEKSFRNLIQWYTQVMTYCNQSIPVVLVENKIDCFDDSRLNAEEVESLAKQHKLRLYRVSAKENNNINDVFEYLIKKAAKMQIAAANLNMIGNNNANPNVVRKSSSAAVLRRAASATSYSSSVDLPQLERAESAEPNRRRTGGVKPVFNRYKCPLM